MDIWLFQPSYTRLSLSIDKAILDPPDGCITLFIIGFLPCSFHLRVIYKMPEGCCFSVFPHRRLLFLGFILMTAGLTLDEGGV